MMSKEANGTKKNYEYTDTIITEFLFPFLVSRLITQFNHKAKEDEHDQEDLENVLKQRYLS